MTSLLLLKIVLTSMGAVTLTIILVVVIVKILKYTMPKRIPKNLPYYSEIPFGGDLFYTYAISEFYEINSSISTDFLEALLLKWIKEGKCVVDSQNQDPRESTIFFTHAQGFKRDSEEALFEFCRANIPGSKTTIRNYQKFILKNLIKINPILSQIQMKEFDKMRNTGVIERNARIKPFTKLNKKYYTLEFVEQVNQLLGFKKYLIDYSIVGFRGSVDNDTLIDFLIFSQLLNIDNVMTKELANINPLILKEKYDKSVGVSDNNSEDQ